MTTFDESLHPRASDGEFATKVQSAPELNLDGARAELEFDEITGAIELLRARQSAVALTCLRSKLREEFPDAAVARFYYGPVDVGILHSISDPDGDEIVDQFMFPDMALHYRVNELAAVVDWTSEGVRPSTYDIADYEFDLA